MASASSWPGAVEVPVGRLALLQRPHVRDRTSAAAASASAAAADAAAREVVNARARSQVTPHGGMQPCWTARQ